MSGPTSGVAAAAVFKGEPNIWGVPSRGKSSSRSVQQPPDAAMPANYYSPGGQRRGRHDAQPRPEEPGEEAVAAGDPRSFAASYMGSHNDDGPAPDGLYAGARSARGTAANAAAVGRSGATHRAHAHGGDGRRRSHSSSGPTRVRESRPSGVRSRASSNIMGDDIDDTPPATPHRPGPEPLRIRTGSFFPGLPAEPGYQETDLDDFSASIQHMARGALDRATPTVRGSLRFAPVTRPTFPVRIPAYHDALPQYHFEAYKSLLMHKTKPDALQAQYYLLGGLQTLPRGVRL